MAQISFSFSGGFWPSSLPLFHGTARPSGLGAVIVMAFMNGSSVEDKELQVDPSRRALVDPKPPARLLLTGHRNRLKRPFKLRQRSTLCVLARVIFTFTSMRKQTSH